MYRAQSSTLVVIVSRREPARGSRSSEGKDEKGTGKNGVSAKSLATEKVAVQGRRGEGGAGVKRGSAVPNTLGKGHKGFRNELHGKERREATIRQTENASEKKTRTKKSESWGILHVTTEGSNEK